MTDFELVIVGGGLASARAIKSYREAGNAGRIMLISRDDVLPYHRPPLSKRYLRGEAEVEDTLVEPGHFYVENDVEPVLQTTVTGVDSRHRRVDVADGRSFAYRTLVIASGARPRRLDTPGADLPGVFSLRTLADAREIRAAAEHGREALVVGGSFIALEVAASLHHLGLGVTLVHRDSGLLHAVEAPELEREVASMFADNDVNLVLPAEVTAFRGHSRVDSIETKIGKTVAADFVVVGVGVEPAVDFLVSSGVALDNGVVVNERFETTVPGIYAIGDVASFYDPLFARRRRVEHWSNASYQGAELGRVLAGCGGYDTVSSFFTELFGLTLKVFGDLAPHDELVVRGSLTGRDLLGFYLAGGRLVAALTIGRSRETEEALIRLIKRRAVLDPRLIADESCDLVTVLGTAAGGPTAMAQAGG